MKLSLVEGAGPVRHVQVADRIGRELTSSCEPLGTLLGESAYRQQVMLDFSNATFIDSTGVSWLVVCLKRFREAGGQFVVHSPPPLIHRVLTSMQLPRVIDIVPTEADARELLKKGKS